MNLEHGDSGETCRHFLPQISAEQQRAFVYSRIDEIIFAKISNFLRVKNIRENLIVTFQFKWYYVNGIEIIFTSF